MRDDSSASQRTPAFPSLIPFALILLATFCLTLPTSARQDDDIVRVDSDLVILNVTVTDQSGSFVKKLKKEDFTILEDGKPQTIESFHVQETPFAAAILLDTSSSMEGRLSLGRAAAIRFLDGMRTEDVAAVYNFDNKVEKLQDFSIGRDLPPLAYDLKAKGWTTLRDAIVMAANDLAGRAEKRRAIVLLSDGFDTKSSASTDRALNAALAANTTIYTVNMMDKTSGRPDLIATQMAAMGALRDFALKTGGTYVATPGGQALNESFGLIIQELRNQYTITYKPSNKARDGRWRAIELKLSKPELNVRTRKGYRSRKT
jgi:Ca-activated chloride channel homolog